MIVGGTMPPVDKIELHAHLVANTLGSSIRVKNVGEILPWVKVPRRVAAVQVQNGSHVV